jgi:hypothetical protein
MSMVLLQRAKGNFWYPCSVTTQEHSSAAGTEIASLMPSRIVTSIRGFSRQPHGVGRDQHGPTAVAINMT